MERVKPRANLSQVERRGPATIPATMEDRVLTIAAMGGALVGSLAGTAVGVWIDSDYAIGCGTVGTLLGSGLFVAAVLYGLLPLWTAQADSRKQRPPRCPSPAAWDEPVAAAWDEPVAAERVVS
ncbi:MAG: hypothetical protein RMJ56_04730 [Gemmataceae bacterium]|nr:hypothetical protein [Gemmata sp.]MDW8196894.1 hypothetical protein [Gemmataceae bacterium]